MKKYILLTLLFFILPLVYAEDVVKSVSTSVTVVIDTGANTVKITTADGDRSYSIGNSSNTFSYSFQKNFSLDSPCEDDFNDVKKIVDAMKIDCSTITTSLKTATSYYEPYLDCVTKRASCDASLISANSEVSRLKPLEAEKTTCVNDKTGLQTNLQKESTDKVSCQSELEVVQKQSKKYADQRLWAILLGVAAVFGYRWWNDRQKEGKSPVQGTGEEPR